MMPFVGQILFKVPSYSGDTFERVSYHVYLGLVQVVFILLKMATEPDLLNKQFEVGFRAFRGEEDAVGGKIVLAGDLVSAV